MSRRLLVIFLVIISQALSILSKHLFVYFDPSSPLPAPLPNTETLVILTRPASKSTMAKAGNSLAYGHAPPRCDVLLDLESRFLGRRVTVAFRGHDIPAADPGFAGAFLAGFPSDVVVYDSQGRFVSYVAGSQIGWSKGLDGDLCLEDGLRGTELKTRWRGEALLSPRRLDPGSERLDEYYHVNSTGGSGGGHTYYDWMERVSPVVKATQSLPYDYPKTTLVAVVLVYDDARFLPPILSYLTRVCDSVVVLVSREPWHGEMRSLDKTWEAVQGAMRSGKITVVVQPWKSETEQRNFGNELVKSLPGGGDKRVLVVDGDEFWEGGGLIRLASRIDEMGLQKRVEVLQQLQKEYPHLSNFNIPTAAYKPQWLRAPMLTYFGNLRSAVDPPESLQILFWVDPYTCDFFSHREIKCEEFVSVTATDARGDVHTIQVPSLGGNYVDESFAKCHHLSYVRTERELRNKFASFEHSGEILEGWIDRKFRRWKEDMTEENLHPTKPEAYKRTRAVGLEEMPSELRSYFFQKCYSQYKAFEGDDLDAFETVCGGSAPAVVDEEAYGDGYLIEFLPPPAERGPPVASGGGAVAGAPPVRYDSVRFAPEGTTASSEFGDARHLTTTVDPAEISPTDINTLDLNFSTSDLGHCEHPQFMIVILCEGEFDLSTKPVFSEVAEILKLSILELLASRDPSASSDDVIVTHCQDLRFCRISSDRFIILLGIHHLSRYTDAGGNVASLASDFPPRDRTALYNFEDAASHVDFKTGRMTEVLRHYPNVWDYSLGNVRSYADAVPGVQHVPLGYVPGLYPDRASTEKYTDVLFYGRLNKYRSSVIEFLRSQSIPVRHLNSGGEGVWGDELRGEIDAAKIVLSLRYFSKGGAGAAQGSASTEWKFTRFYYPLIAGVPVVSEPCGTAEELKYWSSGVAFTEVSEMADRIKQLLSDLEERRRLAEAGRRLLESAEMVETLNEPLRRLIDSRGCNFTDV